MAVGEVGGDGGAGRAVAALLAWGAVILVVCGSVLAAPLGAFTEFRVPTAGSETVGIAASPDGHMWFTESRGNKIGQITPNGLITEFPIPTAFSEPAGIAAGPDGNMWFTEGAQIGRITPKGAITEFPIPTSKQSSLYGIAAGPDGDMWFTDAGANKIGRITPTGGVTEFTIPTQGSSPSGIVEGPDGDMWFSEERGDEIDRITPTGAMIEFRIPIAGGDSYGIAPGRGGDIWFTGVGGNRIGLVEDGPPAAKTTKAKIDSKHSEATFRFDAIGSTSFQCELVTLGEHRKQPRPQFSSCTSPKTYKHLRAGKYTFEVRAMTAASHGTPTRQELQDQLTSAIPTAHSIACNARRR